MTQKSLKIAAGIAMLLALDKTAGAAILPDNTYVHLDTGFSWANSAKIRDQASPDGDCITCDGSTQNNIGSSPIIGFGVGYHLLPQVRADLSLAYRGSFKLNDSDAFGGPMSADISSLSTMVSAYYDIPLGAAAGGWTKVKPFIGAGLGWSHNKVDTLNYTYPAISPGSNGVAGALNGPAQSSDNFAWQLMAGFGIDLSDSVVLDIGYRYFDGGDLLSSQGTVTWTGGAPYAATGLKGNLTAHELTAGFRFTF